MKYITKYIFKYWSLFILATVLFNACDPTEDRSDISGTVDKSALQYTYKQLDAVSLSETTGGNLLALSLTSTANVLWRAYATSNSSLIAMSNERSDTLDLPFEGTYKIVVYAAFKEGAVLDSFNVQTTAANPKTFSDPRWNYLTNGATGKYWKITAKYVGPETPFPDPPSWYQPDISGENWANDSVYFDLNAGYNYKHYNAGRITQSTFKLTVDDTDATRFILRFLTSGITMADNDNSEMAADNVFKVYKLTNDTLVVGQGASLTSSRTSENWAWYWIYVRSDL